MVMVFRDLLVAMLVETSGVWEWGEAFPEGDVQSVSQAGLICSGLHLQRGFRQRQSPDKD